MEIIICSFSFDILNSIVFILPSLELITFDQIYTCCIMANACQEKVGVEIDTKL